VDLGAKPGRQARGTLVYLAGFGKLSQPTTVKKDKEHVEEAKRVKTVSSAAKKPIKQRACYRDRAGYAAPPAYTSVPSSSGLLLMRSRAGAKQKGPRSIALGTLASSDVGRSICRHDAKCAGVGHLVLTLDVLELAVTLGSGSVSLLDVEDASGSAGSTHVCEPLVLCHALEVARVVVDGDV
jgi:hypothetical protein